MLVSFAITMCALVPFANQYQRTLTHKAINHIERELLETRIQLNYLFSPAIFSQPCSALTYELRKSILNLGMTKEIGTFDDTGRVFCTSNEVNVSFYLYKSILQRLDESPERATLSFTKTALTGEMALIYIFGDETLRGLSVLFPTNYLQLITRGILSFGDLDYEIHVAGRPVKSLTLAEPINQLQVTSKRFPVVIHSAVGRGFYLEYLLKNAWIGLLVATIVLLISAQLRQRHITHNSIEYALTNAIKKQNLSVHFQPIVDLKTNKVVGCESLLRWNDPVQGFVSPGIFIPLAEKVGLIEQITRFVLAKAIQLLQTTSELYPQGYVSINISRQVVLDQDFIFQVTEQLKDKPEISHRLVFEITEESVFSPDDLTTLRRHLTYLGNLGIRIAVDDFGTGYSGLNFIRQYPFDIMKIDRVFINNLTSDSNTQPLLMSMLALSETLHMDVVVEGVEEKSQLDILAKLGVRNIQGFYYSTALPEQQFRQYLLENRASPTELLAVLDS
ncbi:EAL domain-containing protein [Vibrio navarrensis]